MKVIKNFSVTYDVNDHNSNHNNNKYSYHKLVKDVSEFLKLKKGEDHINRRGDSIIEIEEIVKDQSAFKFKIITEMNSLSLYVTKVRIDFGDGKPREYIYKDETYRNSPTWILPILYTDKEISKAGFARSIINSQAFTLAEAIRFTKTSKPSTPFMFSREKRFLTFSTDFSSMEEWYTNWEDYSQENQSYVDVLHICMSKKTK